MISPGEDVKVLIELDTLLDTRLATVSFLDPLHPSTLLRTTYRSREHDRFQSKLFSVADYQQSYANRNVQTLQASAPTAMAKYLWDTFTEEASLRESIAGPYIYDIDLNTFPYRLQDNECEELQRILYVQFPTVRNVRVLYLDTKLITPLYLKTGQYSMYVLYDLQKWLELHVKEFEHVCIPRVSLIAPKLRQNDQKVEIDETDEMEVTLHGSLGIFGALELYLQEYVSLRLEDVEYFSLLK